jgi:hypothetical protein
LQYLVFRGSSVSIGAENVGKTEVALTANLLVVFGPSFLDHAPQLRKYLFKLFVRLLRFPSDEIDGEVNASGYHGFGSRAMFVADLDQVRARKIQKEKIWYSVQHLLQRECLDRGCEAFLLRVGRWVNN